MEKNYQVTRKKDYPMSERLPFEPAGNPRRISEEDKYFIKKGTAYFKSKYDAQKVLIFVQHQWPDARIVDYGLGYAVQYYRSGPYWPEKNPIKNSALRLPFEPAGNPRQRGPVDEHLATELFNHIENTRSLHSLKEKIFHNLVRKIARGIYDDSKAPKAFAFLVKMAIKDYAKEYATPDYTANKPTRELVQDHLLHQFKRKVESSESAWWKSTARDAGKPVRITNQKNPRQKIFTGGTPARDYLRTAKWWRFQSPYGARRIGQGSAEEARKQAIKMSLKETTTLTGPYANKKDAIGL